MQRPIVSLLPQFFYALSMGGIPILIAILAAHLPILQKLAAGTKRMESILRWVTGICVIVLLISAWLPWMTIYLKSSGKITTSYKNFNDHFYFKIREKYPLSLSEIITVTTFNLTLFIGAFPIEVEIHGKEHVRRKILLLRSLLSGALSIISVTSWIYEIETIRTEPVHLEYVAYYTGAGPLLTMISGLLIIFLSYLYVKVTMKAKMFNHFKRSKLAAAI